MSADTGLHGVVMEQPGQVVALNRASVSPDARVEDSTKRRALRRLSSARGGP